MRSGINTSILLLNSVLAFDLRREDMYGGEEKDLVEKKSLVRAHMHGLMRARGRTGMFQTCFKFGL